MRVTKYGKRSEIKNYVIWPMYIEQSEETFKVLKFQRGNILWLKMRLLLMFLT